MTSLVNIISNIKKGVKMKKMIKIIGGYNYCNKEINRYKIFSDIKYKKNLIYRNKDYELFLICWKPGQISKIHNHSDNGCVFKVLEGTMTEFKYDIKNIKLLEEKKYDFNNVGYIDNEMAFHKFGNLDSNQSISLHLYSPPEKTMKIFS